MKEFASNIDPNTKNNYPDQYMHPQWQVKRQEILQRDQWQCRNCGSRENLVVHHRQYHCDINTRERLEIWDYDNRYLITLCNRCHEQGHKELKVPTYYIKK